MQTELVDPCLDGGPLDLGMKSALEALDPLETLDYRQAVEVVPALVERETPFPAYLRATQGNPVEAARRIARFWKFRRDIFGTQRWLLPMVQTGTGALNQMEIDFIQSGFIMLIEREKSGPVILVDFSRAMELFTKARALQMDTLAIIERVGMYFGVVFADVFSQGPVAYLHPITSKKRPEMEFRTRLWDMFHNSYPGNLTDVVIVQSCETGKKELLDFLRFQSANVIQLSTGLTPKQVCANTPDETMFLLESYGIPRHAVPMELGGYYDYDARVAEWVNARLRIESLKPSPIPSVALGPSPWVARSPNVVKPIHLPRQAVAAQIPEKDVQMTHARVPSKVAIQEIQPKIRGVGNMAEATVLARKHGEPERFSPPPPHLVEETEKVLASLDKYETREYMEAMEIVPGLVQKETPIDKFLKVVQNDTLAAACRIAKFWKLRKVLFSDRWLLPMTQTGAGALCDLDINFVRTGFAFLIPRFNTGPIIVVDFCRAAKVFAKARALQADTLALMERIGMYLSVAFLDDFSRGPSVLLHPVTSKERPELEIRNRFWEMFRTAFPGCLQEVVVAQSFEDGKQQLLDFMGYHTARVLHFSTQIKPNRVSAGSVNKVINQLEEISINRDLVPVDLGGCYDMDSQVALWTRTRLSVESMIGPVSSSVSTKRNGLQAMFKPSGHNLLLNREEGKSEEDHRRERNRLYVRRHYQKRRMECASFEGQKEQLEAQNQALKEQNQELERTLEIAKMLVKEYFERRT